MMNKAYTFLIYLIMLPLLTVLLNTAVSGQQAPASDLVKESDPVEVYYFHRSRRCASCHTIEKLTRQTVETQFADELEKGTLELHILNIELPENKEIALKYKVSGVALIVASNSNKTENADNFTASAYRHLRNEEAFTDALKKVINKNMNR